MEPALPAEVESSSYQIAGCADNRPTCPELPANACAPHPWYVLLLFNPLYGPLSGPLSGAASRGRDAQNYHRAVPDKKCRTAAPHYTGRAPPVARARRVQLIFHFLGCDSDRPADGFRHGGDVHGTVGRDDARR